MVGTQRPLLIWLNGPFGGGKSSVAHELIRTLADRGPAVLFDPELVGATLRDEFPVPTGDFQDLPQWRERFMDTVARLHRDRSSLVVTPMSVLRRDYLDELLTGLRATGARVLHVVLDASPETLEHRIATDEHEPTAFGWRTQKLEVFLEARPWLTASADLVVPTDALSVEEVALRVVTQVAG